MGKRSTCHLFHRNAQSYPEFSGFLILMVSVKAKKQRLIGRKKEQFDKHTHPTSYSSSSTILFLFITASLYVPSQQALRDKLGPRSVRPQSFVLPELAFLQCKALASARHRKAWLPCCHHKLLGHCFKQQWGSKASSGSWVSAGADKLSAEAYNEWGRQGGRKGVDLGNSDLH